MGYTHYWRQLRDFTDTEWQELTRLTKLITVGARATALLDPDEFNIDNEEIRFNGVRDDAHETFLITKKKRLKADYEEQEAYDRQGAFDFCKTAHKPYDKYVTAVLCALYNIKVEEWPLGDGKIMSISSDGNTADWKEGLFHAVRSTRVEEMYCPIRDCLTLSYVDYVDQEKETG
jgi:hypothetical protein|tara:strand:- start:19 stop:543 length:525 start_codon:yes stop_codon:yes gene_type:complete